MDDVALMTNPNLIRTGANGGGAVYWDTSSGQQVAVGRKVADLLESLRTPASADELAASTTAGPDLRRLREIGLLVDHRPGSPADTGLAAIGHGLTTGLFGSPRMSLAMALRTDTVRVVAVGMPYDVGVTGRPGTRFGPSYLRGASQTLFRRRSPDDVGGMYDPVRQRRVLAGVGLADVGDITAEVHTRNGDTMDVLERVVGAVVSAGKFPVVLGGDHSITLPAVRGVLAARPGLGIIHFDAHSDYRRPRTGPWRADCHHGNHLDWLVGDARVSRLVQFGIRQLVHDRVAPHDKVTVWPGTSAATAGVATVLDSLPDDVPYYLTIDVDCLDPTVMPSTGTPLPGGFSAAQVIDLLDGMCAAREIVGVDLVEYLPDGHPLAGHVAAELLLRTIDGAVPARPAG